MKGLPSGPRRRPPAAVPGPWTRAFRNAPADGWLAALLAVVLLSVDASLVSRFHNFDAVACAMAVETGNFRHLVHGNHVLYGLLGWLFDGMFRFAGFGGRALVPLGVLNRLLHAACGALALLLLRRLGAGRFAALAGALGLSFSYAAWFYALEPHVYLLGLLGLLLSALFLFPERRRPALAGLGHALAIGGHATHVLLLPCAAYLLWPRKKELRRYLEALGAGTAAIYLMGLWIYGPHGFADALRWLSGTAAIGEARRFAWHGPIDPLAWIRGLVGAIWAQGGPPSFFVRAGPAFRLQAAATALALAVGVSIRSKDRRLAAALALWLGAYFVFFSTWEPDNMNYHLGDLVPFWVLLTLALDRQGALGRLLLSLSLGAVLINSGQTGIRALTLRGVNPWIERMERVREATPELAWVATLDDSGKVYLPYFAFRRPLILRERASRPDVLKLNEPVYVPTRVMEDGVWGPRLRKRFRLEKAGAGLVKLERKSDQSRDFQKTAVRSRLSRP